MNMLILQMGTGQKLEKLHQERYCSLFLVKRNMTFLVFSVTGGLYLVTFIVDLDSDTPTSSRLDLIPYHGLTMVEAVL